MILKFFLSLWYKEGIVFKNLKPSKNELRIGDAAGFAPYLLIEDKTLNEWDQGVYQEIVRAILHFLFDNLTSALVYHTIDLSVRIGCSMHRNKVNALN